MKSILSTFFLLFSLLACNTVEQKPEPTTLTDNKPTHMESQSIYNFSYSSPDGEEKSMESFKNQIVLVVNTATKCGLTPQFAGLEELHQEFGAKGLKVLGFPCNQFGGQEPLTNEEMVETCKINHGVTFELAQKIEVNGQNATDFYKFLKSEQKITGDNEIRWNFEKFLIDKNGKVVARFSPQTKPSELKSEIEKLMN